jgi:signal transduction histidine kinase/CheY-like chemotaxis protein
MRAAVSAFKNVSAWLPGHWRTQRAAVVAIVGVLMLVVVTVAGIQLIDTRQERLGDGRRETANLTRALVEQTTRYLQAVDQQLIRVRRHLESGIAPNSPEMERSLSDIAIGVARLGIVGPDGKFISHSDGAAIPGLDVSDREFFVKLRDQPAAGLYLGRPVNSRVAGSWGFHLARRISGPNGEFLGVVVAMLEAEYFEKLYSAVQLGDDGSIALFRADGALLARYPHAETMIGRTFEHLEIFKQPDGEKGWVLAKSFVDGVVRLVSYRRVPGYPLYVVASVSEATVLASWQREAVKTFMLAAARLAVLALLLLLILRYAKAHEELVRGEERLRLALQAGRMFAVERDLATDRVVRIGSGDMFGLGDGNSEDLFAIVHPDDVERVRGAFDKKNIRKAGSLDIEYRVRKPDGSFAWVLSKARIVFGALSGTERQIGITMDVSDRHAAEQQVQSAARRLEAVLESTTDCVYVIDADWRISYVNNRAKSELSRADDLLGKKLWDAFPTAVGGPFWAAFHEAMQERTPITVEAFFEPMQAWYQVHASPLDDGLSMFFQNVTERRAAEDQLRQSQKMEAIGQLSGGVAHDFNNLLTIIMGNSETLLDDLPQGDPNRPMAEVVLRAAERGSELTQRLLAFGRRQPLKPALTDCNGVVNDTAKLLQRTLGERVALKWDANGIAWPIAVDPGQLENALVNLAVNSRDAMPDGGTITIRVDNVAGNDPRIASGDFIPGDYVMIAVADTGRGIAPELQARVFEPFFTTKELGKGTGLGLSSVFGFVKQSGGHVLLHSRCGEGTVVSLFFPRAAGACKDVRPLRAIPAARQERVLLVEDDAGVRRTIARMVAGLGYEVSEASNADAALRILDGGESFDLLLTDVVMPGSMSGWELGIEARNRRPELKVLLASGYAEEMAADGKSVTELLRKPFRREDLASMLRRVLEQDSAAA